MSTVAGWVACVDSFVDATGSVVGTNGRRYYFEFHEMFGPSLTDKEGNILKIQPESPNHPFWKPFNAWLQQRILLRYGRTKGTA